MFFLLLSGKNFQLRVPRSGTSMRNPLQAAKWCSCGLVRMQGTVPWKGTYAIGCQQDV